MGTNPYQVVKDFEQAIGEYTGAPHAVTTSSATMALLLAVAYHLRYEPTPHNLTRPTHRPSNPGPNGWTEVKQALIEIPKRTYVSVPQSIIHAGGWPIFRDEQWVGSYQLKPLRVWDAARVFTSGMYQKIACDAIEHPQLHAGGDNAVGGMVVVSFHWSKILGIQQGGAILLDDPEAAAWLRRARFDGRTEGVPVKDDKIDMIGWHCYLSPEIAAEGLQRIGLIPKHNEPLPWDDYPPLDKMEVFR